MPIINLLRTVQVERTPRVLQLEGLFDIPPTHHSTVALKAHVPFDAHPWNIGLIVGPSGSGKTTIARELFGNALIDGFPWPETKSLVDGFPAGMGVKEVTLLLSSVGFSSPPSWLRPFHVLSQGEQFRATLARALAERRELAVVDEFTSVVDRTVARIGSAAIAKTVRRQKRRFVAVSCHYDIIDWLQPDWIYEPAGDAFQWRSLRRPPSLELEIRRVPLSAWDLFRPHHYLSGELNRGAKCFAALVKLPCSLLKNGDWLREVQQLPFLFHPSSLNLHPFNSPVPLFQQAVSDAGEATSNAEPEPAAFTAVLPFPHLQRSGWREHRTVCLPDFQGIGIGNALSEFVASLFRATGKPYFSTTANPAMLRHRARSPLWKTTRPMSLIPARKSARGVKELRRTVASDRLTASFEYIGPPRETEALELGVTR